MTNMQTAAQVAAQLTSLTNCKDTESILETFNYFFDEVSEKLGSDKVVINNTQISNTVSSPPLKKKVTCGYFSVSAILICFL